jgi:hypothetical protein
MKATSMSETAWSHAFVARLTQLGVTAPHEQLVAKGREFWALIGDVDPEAVARQEFKGWVLPVSPR